MQTTALMTFPLNPKELAILGSSPAVEVRSQFTRLKRLSNSAESFAPATTLVGESGTVPESSTVGPGFSVKVERVLAASVVLGLEAIWDSSVVPPVSS